MGFFDSIFSMFGASKPSEDTATPTAADETVARVASGDGESSDDGEDRGADDADDGDGGDDDDFRRDYALEARDDSGPFDFSEDLRPYYVAQFEIEQGWEDRATRLELLAKHEVRNEQHWYQITATLERYLASADGQARWGGAGDVAQIKMDCTMDHMRGQMAGLAAGALATELEPEQGVTLQQWAEQQAKLAGGGTVESACAALGIDKAKWDAVSAEWNARMSRDTSGTIATEYGRQFSSAGAGAFGGAAQAGAAAMGAGGTVGDDESAAPIPLERYVEVEQAQGCGAVQGKDPIAILASFGMTPLDWSNVGAWWSQFIARNAMKNDAELHRRYSDLQAKYEAKYRVAGADQDLTF